MEDDYYNAINGKWIRNTEIPRSHSRYSEFDMLMERNYQRIQHLLTLPSTPDILKTFYNTAMQPRKETIDFIKAHTRTANLVGEMTVYGFPHLFDITVSPDLKNERLETIYIDEPSLPLPNKHYYFSPKYASYLDAYTRYLKNSIERYGLDIDAEKVLDTELKIAKMCMEKEDKRNIETIYNPMTLKEFNRHFDTSGIIAAFRERGVDIELPPKVIVENVKLVKELKKLGDTRDYLKWQVYNNSFPFLNDDTEAHHFNFYGKVLSGSHEMKPRHITVINLMTNLMGDLLGYHYGKTYYTKEVRDKMQSIIRSVKRAMKDKLATRTWMTSRTRAEALKKLSNMKYKIGHPKKVEDYDVRLTGSHFNHTRQLIAYDWASQLRSIGQPSDNEGWEMGAHEVNAYYSLVKNEMVFPAGIIQPPFFDLNRSDEANFGAIGTIIGHEISHGFDDQGKKFDSDGSLRNWWTKRDKLQYKKEAQKMVRQFDALYESGFKINGKLTLGENLADLGGVSIALSALERKHKDPDYHEFFSSYAALWRQLVRKEEIARRVKSDPHSLGKFRVNQILKNIPQFGDTYAIEPDNGMYLKPRHRVNLWL